MGLDLQRVVGDPFQYSSGPTTARIALVGEAWGREEALAKRPFVGTSGQELDRMLAAAGIDRGECFFTNVLAFQPNNNDLTTLCGRKADVGPAYNLPPFTKGKYLLPQYLGEIERLRLELAAVRPHIVVALGNAACWALLGRTGIASIRGSVAIADGFDRVKVLPTFHPASVLRNWEQRPIVIADLLKTRREAGWREFRRPERTVIIDPTISAIAQWASRDHQILAIDTETRRGQIRCIQFARSPWDAITIPFWVGTGSYWKTLEEELEAWALVRKLLVAPCPKVFQNGLYDLQYLLRYGLKPSVLAHDTMLHHHALYPELNKGLGFMGSLYTNEMSWKLMHRHKETKADDT